MTTSGIKMSEIVGGGYDDFWNCKKRYRVLKGGKGSKKSATTALNFIFRLMKEKDTNLLVVRQVMNTHRDSTFAQLKWAQERLGVSKFWSNTVSPMEMVYKPTGQKIMFFGADDPGKVKSIKTPFGHIGILHFEELDQFAGEEEVRSLEQSILRGGDYTLEFKTFNPPKTKNNWANQYCLIDKPGQMVHHSTYLTTPREWLGERFWDDAEHLKAINPSAYEHEYMGVANGTGGMVFDNVELRSITDEEKQSFDRIYNGLDWGYYPDPWAFNQMHYDAARRTLYIFGELTRYKAGNKDTADDLFEYGLTEEDKITADSAEPKSIADYRNYGLYCRGAAKGPGSVEYSMKWLQSLNAIVIDPVRCPDTAREFQMYEYERNKNGEVISGYPDRDNHHIDAVRYGTEPIWKRRGQ